MLARVSPHINTIMSRVRKLIEYFEHGIRLSHFANEEDITSQLAGQLKNALSYSAPDFSIQCRAIVTKKTSEEPVLGADILVVISFDSPELCVSKGFLAQAKNVELDKSIGSTRSMQKLQDQCRKMLDHTPESYVWLYSGEAFRVQRASTIEALKTNKPDDVFSHRFLGLFQDFLISMRGDPTINLQDFPRLQSIIKELHIPFVLLISATSTGESPHGDREPLPVGGPPDLDAIVRRLDGISLDEWSSSFSQRTREQSPQEAEEPTKKQTDFQQHIQLRED